LLFDASTNPETGEKEYTNLKQYQPYSQDPSKYFAAQDPLTKQVYGEAAGMQGPSQFGTATGLAGAAGQAGLNAQQTSADLMGGALGYGAAGSQYGASGAEQARADAMRAQQAAERYGQMGAGYGQQAAGLAGAAQGYGQRAADIGEMGLRAEQLGRDVSQQARDYASQQAGAGAQFQRQVTDPSQVQSFMSPYQQAVTDITKKSAIRDAQMLEQGNRLSSARQGTYGGARQALASLERERNLGANLANIQAQGSQSAYDKAMQQMQFGSNLGLQGLSGAQSGLGTALQGAQTGLSGIGTAMQGQQAGLSGLGQAGSLLGQGMQGAQTGLSSVGQMLGAGQLGLSGAQTGIQGAQAGLAGVGQGINAGQYGLQGAGTANQAAGTLGNLGTSQQQADLARMGFQGQMGSGQQQYNQNIINQAIQDFATSQQYPYMQLGFMSNLLRGLPMQTMSSQNYQAQPSFGQQAAGLLGTGASLYGAFGRKAGGTIKEYAGGGNVRASLENKIDDIGDAGGVKGLQALLAQTKSPQAKQMIAERMREEGIARANTGGLMTNMAGGGIIAFDNGGGVEEEMSELDKIRANNEAIKRGLSDLFTLRNFDPIQSSARAYKQFVYDPITKAVNQSPEEQAVGFRKASDARDAKRSMFSSSKEEQKKDDRDIAAAKVEADIRKKTEAAKAKQQAGFKFDPEAIDREEAGIGAALRANQTKPKPDTPPPASPAAAANQDETGIDAILEARRKRLGIDGPGEKNEALMKALEERQAGMGKQNETDRYLRMAEAFAKFGSTAGPIGRTASEALGGFAKGEAAARKEQDKMQVEGMKIQADLEKARRAEARGDLDAAERLYTSAEDRSNRLQVSREAANRPGEFEKMMAAFRANPKEFEQFRKSLTASDDTARLNAMVKADTALANNLKYMNLLNSKKPEDQQAAATMRTNLINEYMSALGATQPSAPGKVIDFGSIK
jgi:hypothetical protein